MLRICTRLLLMLLGFGLAIFATSTWAATECTGPAPLSGKVTGGVVVNKNDFCLLLNAKVTGGVQVNSGGVLIVCASTINGGLVSDGATAVIVGAEELPFCSGDVINGAIQITNTGPSEEGGPPSVALENSTINGAVHLTGNQGAIAVASNIIKGGLFCSNNSDSLDDEGHPSVITGPVRCDFE